MFDEKKLRLLKRRLARPLLDELDLQAAAEGGAVAQYRRGGLEHRLGRRGAKNHRESDGGRKTAELKSTRELVAATAARARDIIIGRC